MSSTVIKNENLFPEKVCYCPCLKNSVDEIFNNEIRSYTEMMLGIQECCVCVIHKFTAREQKRKR